MVVSFPNGGSEEKRKRCFVFEIEKGILVPTDDLPPKRDREEDVDYTPTKTILPDNLDLLISWAFNKKNYQEANHLFFAATQFVLKCEIHPKDWEFILHQMNTKIPFGSQCPFLKSQVRIVKEAHASNLPSLISTMPTMPTMPIADSDEVVHFAKRILTWTEERKYAEVSIRQVGWLLGTLLMCFTQSGGSFLCGSLRYWIVAYQYAKNARTQKDLHDWITIFLLPDHPFSASRFTASIACMRLAQIVFNKQVFDMEAKEEQLTAQNVLIRKEVVQEFYTTTLTKMAKEKQQTVDELCNHFI
jgi:hypothetical protein